MTIRGRHRLAAIVLLATFGTACGGGSRSTAEVNRAAAHESSATTTTTQHRADAVETASVVQPAVIDRGDDYGAIAASLVTYVRWLERHHPDPALVARAYQAGSPPAKVAIRHINEMRRIGAHIVEVDAAPFDFTMVSVRRDVVSMRMTEHLAHREAISGNGRVLARDRARTEQYLISIARTNARHPWRVNLVERVHAEIEVQL